jgi:hypothetical protein
MRVKSAQLEPNWRADLLCDQGIVGLYERNPCFPEGVYVGEEEFSVGDSMGYLGWVN